MSKQELLEHTASRLFATMMQDATAETPGEHIACVALWAWDTAALFVAARPEPEQQTSKKRKGRR